MKCSVASTRSLLVDSLRVAAVALTFACNAGFSTSAAAGLIFEVTTNSGETGSSSNSLDVLLANTGTTDASIAGFSFEITAAGTDVTFINVTTSTISDAYFFAGNSLYGPDITFGLSTDGHTISANDNYKIPNADVTLAAGQTLGLGHVNFALSSSAPVSPISITFTDAPTTGVNDSAGHPENFVLPVDAHIVVSPGPTSVPEPSTIVSLGIGMIGLIVAMKARRKVSLAA